MVYFATYIHFHNLKNGFAFVDGHDTTLRENVLARRKPSAWVNRNIHRITSA